MCTKYVFRTYNGLRARYFREIALLRFTKYVISAKRVLRAATQGKVMQSLRRGKYGGGLCEEPG